LEIHIQKVHHVSRNGAPSRRAGDVLRAQTGAPKDEAGRSLASYSKPKLIDLVVLEKEKYETERRRRIRAEEELGKARQRYQDREDVWLKLMARN